jgi:hypothetical protein
VGLSKIHLELSCAKYAHVILMVCQEI